MRYIKGFTIVELMIAVVVLGVIVTLAAPSFIDSIERRRLERAGEAVYNAIHYARSEAIKQGGGADVRIQFASTGSGAWCYGIDDNGTDCDCNATTPSCTVSGESKVFKNNMGGGEPYPGVDFDASATDLGGDDLTYEGGRGWATDLGISFTRLIVLRSANYAYCIEVSQIGRIQVLSNMIGYTDSNGVSTCN